MTITEQITALGTESLMRLHAEIGAELERRYRVAKAEQSERAQTLRPSRVIHSSPFEPPTLIDDRGQDPDQED